MSESDLKLNNFSRYSKKSTQFTLEVHDHCEVPAGCGGVVLRWISPQRTIPVCMWLYTPGTAQFFMDGAKPRSSRPLLEYGEHVIAISIKGVSLAHGILMFAASNLVPNEHCKMTGPPPKPFSVVSALDGSWKYSLDEPGDEEWKELAFDDSGWLAMVEKPVASPDKLRSNYQYERLIESGAASLAVPGQGFLSRVSKRSAWVRKRFLLARQD